MEEFVKGDVVIIPFPFSDLSSIKLRFTPSNRAPYKDASSPHSLRTGAIKFSNLHAFGGGEVDKIVSLLDQ